MSARYTALALTLFASIPTTAATGQVADSIYLGGPILTMDDQQPRAEAVAVADGKIIGVGSRAEIERAHRTAQTALHDLQGHALLPAFFDAHSHFSMVGLQAISANLLPPPDGPGSSIAELQTALREHLAAHPEARDEPVDRLQLRRLATGGKRHPTRQELDAVATDIPIVAIHQSGHLGVYNSLALKQAGIDATTVNPEGGVIIREADGVTPNGVMEENAHIATLIRLIPRFTAAQHADMLNRAQQIYLANGFTTVQEGRASADTVLGMQQAADAGLLKLDLVIYPDLEQTLDSPVLTGPLMSHDYRSHLRLGGVKLTFDGSPQGKTAWFTQPYAQPPEHEQAGYRGRPIFADDAVPLAMMRKAYAHGWQLLIHTNGDAAIDQMIRLVRMAQPGNPPSSAAQGAGYLPLTVSDAYILLGRLAPHLGCRTGAGRFHLSHPRGSAGWDDLQHPLRCAGYLPRLDAFAAQRGQPRYPQRLCAWPGPAAGCGNCPQGNDSLARLAAF